MFALNLAAIWLMIRVNKFDWYKIAGSILFIGLPLLGVFDAQPRFELDFFWWRIAGIVLIAAGAILVYLALQARKLSLEIITAGPYKYVRHPIYLGLIFVYVGWWWVWSAVFAFYFGMFILALIWLEGYLEEEFILRKRWGERFLEYKRTTGMFWVK